MTRGERVPGACVIDVTRWWLSVLLNRRHNLFVSFERNIVYLFVNLAEVVLAGAIWLRMTSPTGSAEVALFTAFFLATQLSSPPRIRIARRCTSHHSRRLTCSPCWRPRHPPRRDGTIVRGRQVPGAVATARSTSIPQIRSTLASVASASEAIYHL